MSEQDAVGTDHDIPQYNWWPDGVPVRNLTPPDCAYCRRLLHALARQRRGRPATTTGDATLTAFADGGAKHNGETNR